MFVELGHLERVRSFKTCRREPSMPPSDKNERLRIGAGVLTPPLITSVVKPASYSMGSLKIVEAALGVGSSI